VGCDPLEIVQIGKQNDVSFSALAVRDYCFEVSACVFEKG
jgi:hypothetical protein